MQKGDLVVKQGDYDRGCIGVVLFVFTNSMGHKFVQVLNDNKVKLWYYNNVNLLQYNDT
tara:strand:- start:9 stop:185 length:177 start_codon:yes stop_codon:yes gene_type:complete